MRKHGYLQTFIIILIGSISTLALQHILAADMTQTNNAQASPAPTAPKPAVAVPQTVQTPAVATTTQTPAVVAPQTVPTPAVATTPQTAQTPTGATSTPTIAKPTVATPQVQKSSTVAPTTVSQQRLINFAQHATLAVFNYDHKNYKEKIQRAATFFTPQGWKDFSDALTATNNLTAVSQFKLIVTAALNGQALVASHEQTSYGDRWQVNVPILVSYKDPQNKVLTQELMTKITIIMLPNATNSLALAVDRMIAGPDLKATAPK